MCNLFTHSLELLSDGPPAEISSSGSEHSAALPDPLPGSTNRPKDKDIGSFQSDRHGFSHNALPAYTDRRKVISRAGISSPSVRSRNNPPVIDVTDRTQQSATMNGQVADASTDQALGLNSGMISGDSCQRDAAGTELANTQNFRTSVPPVYGHVEARPPKIMKLMGAFMGPGVRPDRIDPHGAIKQSHLFNQGLQLPDSESSNTAIHRSGKRLVTALITDASSSNLGRIPAGITRGSTGSSVRDLINVESRSLHKKSKPMETGSQRLKFTEDVLDFSNTPPEYRRHFLDALGDVLDDLKTKELVMTEAQFIIYHTDFYRICQRSHESDPRSDSKTNISYAKKYEAYKHMIEHKQDWYSHWSTLTQVDFETSITKINLKSNELVLPYLFYVEMISTVVPLSTRENDLGIHLKEAWELLETIFDSKRIEEEEGRDRDKIYEKFITYERFNSLGLSSKVSILWDLLEIWLDRYRKSLSDEILAFGRTYHTIKAFFNSIFFLSVENLTKTLIQ